MAEPRMVILGMGVLKMGVLGMGVLGMSVLASDPWRTNTRNENEAY